jgi:hypothetical protein
MFDDAIGRTRTYELGDGADNEFKVVVTELRYGFNYRWRIYWVHGLIYDINAIMENNGNLKGKGVKKYKNEIMRAISLFKTDGKNVKTVIMDGVEVVRPAVIYDTTDYYIYDFGEMEDLENAAGSLNIVRPNGLKFERIDHSKVAIARIPSDQGMIDRICRYTTDESIQKLIESQVIRPAVLKCEGPTKRINKLLDMYNDYQKLYEQFGDIEYKKMADTMLDELNGGF